MMYATLGNVGLSSSSLLSLLLLSLHYCCNEIGAPLLGLAKYIYYTCKLCKGSMVKAKYETFFEEITFPLRYALGMRQLLCSVPFLLFSYHTEHM